jgi:large subunit ribosomal protein L28
MPAYPYGKNPAFKEANFGLYGGTTLQSGNKISKGRNKGKTLRKWFPNVRIEKLRSEALDTELKIPVTARVLRTIRKCGGLDEYVCGTKPARIKELGLLGWKLRWLVMTSPKYQEKSDAERRALGLPVSTSLSASFEEAWNDESQRTKLIEQQESAWADLRDAAARFEKHVLDHWVENGEKEAYEIPKLETLRRRNPGTLDLPERLEPSPANPRGKVPTEVLPTIPEEVQTQTTVDAA